MFMGATDAHSAGKTTTRAAMAADIAGQNWTENLHNLRTLARRQSVHTSSMYT